MSLVNAQYTTAATVQYSLYTVTAGKKLIYNLTACNKGATAASIRLAHTIGATTTYLEYGLPLTAAGTTGNVLERTGLKLPAGAIVKIYSDANDVDWTLDGIEETA